MWTTSNEYTLISLTAKAKLSLLIPGEGKRSNVENRRLRWRRIQRPISTGRIFIDKIVEMDC